MTSKKKMTLSAQEFDSAVDRLADVVGVERQRFRLGLIRCLIRKIGVVELFRCLSSGDWLNCLSNVDWEGVLDCVMNEFGGGGDGGFD